MLRKVSDTVCGFARVRRIGKDERQWRNGRGRTVKLARLARDEGLITTLEEYLRATVCAFHPRPSFVRSFVAVSVFPFSCLLLSPASPCALLVLSTLWTATTSPSVHFALRVSPPCNFQYIVRAIANFCVELFRELSHYPLRRSFLPRELFILLARKLVQKFTDIVRVCVNS